MKVILHSPQKINQSEINSEREKVNPQMRINSRYPLAHYLLAALSRFHPPLRFPLLRILAPNVFIPVSSVQPSEHFRPFWDDNFGDVRLAVRAQ